MKLKLLATAAFFAFSSGAMAADAVDAKIQELFSQGYTHFQVQRGTSSSKIEAYGANQPKLEMRVSSSTGAILSQSMERDNDADHTGDMARISATATSYNDNDDDRNEADDDGADDGVHTSSTGSVYGSGSGWGDDDNDDGSDNDDVGGVETHSSGSDDNGANHDSGSDDNGSDHDSGSDDNGSDHDSGSDDHDGGDDD